MAEELKNENTINEQLSSEVIFLRKRIAELESNLAELTKKRESTRLTLLAERNLAQGYLDVAEVIMVVLNTNGQITMINRKGCRILGYREEELIGKNWFQYCLPPDSKDSVYNVFKLLMKGEIKNQEYYENSVITHSGSKRLIAWHNSLLYNEEAVIMGILSSGEDITDRKYMEQALKNSEEKYRMLAENSSDVIWTLNINLEPTYISPSIQKLRGFTASEAMKQPIDEMLTSSSLKTVFQIVKKQLDMERIGILDFALAEPLQLEFYHKNGSTVWAESSVSFLRNAQGGLIGYMGVTRDVTERKETEEKLMASLKEKEILLKEVHHRVKNNMAIISSLLSLQAESLNDPAVKSAFRDSQHRIRSMALVHEKLYQANDLSRIDFCDYIRGLVHQISKSNEFRNRLISVDIQADDIQMTIETAIPCGLIISELLTNSFKYAFPGNCKGEILIQMRIMKKNFYKLLVSDNGIGLPLNVNMQDFSSFGLHLVHLLTKQLDGEIEITREQGTEYKIIFPFL